uniref:Uncharacterized protein n=1 Tax=Scleropages formosus TaxID=113540 RepID=A0A8C9SEM5_SCLFO
MNTNTPTENPKLLLNNIFNKRIHRQLYIALCPHQVLLLTAGKNTNKLPNSLTFHKRWSWSASGRSRARTVHINLSKEDKDTPSTHGQMEVRS